MASTIFTAARLFDGTGAAPLHEAFVEIDDGKILNVGRNAELGSRAAAARDLGDATLLPGLINMHTHLTLSASTQVLQDALGDSAEVKLMRAVEHARKAIESGVTTIRDCGSANAIVFAVREASARGLITAPHVWASGDVLTTTGGHCWFFGTECDTRDEAVRAVRRQVKAGADFIKVIGSGGGLTPNTNPRESQYDRETMVALTRDARRMGRYVAVHCHGSPSIHDALAARVRTIEHCSFLADTGLRYEQETADEIAAQGIYVCPTLGVGVRRGQALAREGKPYPMGALAPTRYDNLRRMRAAGIKFVSGNDAGVSMATFDDFQLDLEMLVEHIGFSCVEAIMTATGTAAEAIGSAEFGTLQPGRRADVIAVRGDALADIGALRRVRLVLKSGQVVVDRDAAG